MNNPPRIVHRFAETVKAKRVLYLTHRWFGVLMCLVFFLWFASGIVMMYVEYPQLTRQERVQSLSPLPVDEIQVDLPEELMNSDGRITEVSIYSHLERPVYLVQFDDQTSSAYFADTGDSIPQTTEITAEQAARIFAGNAGLGEGASYVKALHMDQWTVYGGFTSHRPLHQVALDNPQGTILYISDSTGQVVRDTHAWERAWNWVGSTIHWIYPMQLRKYPGTWANVVIVISMLGIVAVVTGTVVGFLRLRTAKRYKNGSVTPYQGMQKWHHLLGLAFTLFVTTFVVSGLFSMNPFGIFDDESSPAPQISRYKGGALRLEGLRSALDSIPEEMADIKELSWHQINGAGVLVAHSNAGRRAINLSSEELEAKILESVPLLVPAHPEFQLDELDEFDNYYYSTHNRYRPLPAYRVRFSDEERTWYYIDAETGEILFRSTAINRVERWLYNGLHSLDFQFLFANRPLWDIVVIVLSLAGIVFSYTAVVIGWRRLKRTKVRGNRKTRALQVTRFSSL